MKFDLHVHTEYSDGCFSPNKVIDLAVERGLDGIAITDHDTVLGIQEAADYSRNYKNFELIPGIELGSTYMGEEVHILGYFIDYTSQKLLTATKALRKNRVERGKRIIDKLQLLNIDITYKEVKDLSKDDFIGRVHIAKILVLKKCVTSITEAFDKYLNKGAPAYVMRNSLSIKDSIELINEADGIAVLAHPGILENKSAIIDHCIESGIQGIECIHSKHSDEDTQIFKQICKQNNLLMTAGSDCHGEIINNNLLLGKFFIGRRDILKLKESI